MLDEGKLLAIVGVLSLMIIIYFNLALLPLGILGFVLAYAYAGYWGLAIRRGLVMGAYRNQAIGVSSSALYVVLLSALSGTIPVAANSSLAVDVVNGLVDFGWLLILLYWITTTVTVARRSDPLERDTLHFSLTRYIWAVALVIPAAASLVHNGVALAYTAAVPLDPLSFALALAPFAVLLPFGIVLLFLSASRSRDRTLKRHIKWFAGALAALLPVFLGGTLWRTTGGNSSPYALVINPLFIGGQFLAAYCFYRSARSLAPLTKDL